MRWDQFNYKCAGNWAKRVDFPGEARDMILYMRRSRGSRVTVHSLLPNSPETLTSYTQGIKDYAYFDGRSVWITRDVDNLYLLGVWR